jgi:hypothetical protein
MTNIKINKIIENMEKNNEKIMKNLDKYNKIIKELSDIEEIICSNINIIKEPKTPKPKPKPKAKSKNNII